jgi:hypothetical protein
LAVKHRGIDFDVEEVSPSQWRWKIYQKIGVGPKIISGPEYRNRAQATIACVNKINSELGAANDAYRRKAPADHGDAEGNGFVVGHHR